MPSCRPIKLFFLFFFWVSSGFSQNYPARNYTAANELPNNSVRSLLVDSNNILWIGTENGVVRKENDVLKYFFEEDGLALNSCWAIAEDRNGKLWFGSYGGGLSIYDGKKFRVISEDDGLAHEEITKFFSHENLMYVGTSDGVSIVDVNTFEVFSLKTPPNDQLFRVTGFFEYREEIYVATYRSGIYKIVYDNNRPILVKINDHKFIYSVFIKNDSIFSSNKGFFTKSSLADYVGGKGSGSSEKLGYSILWDHIKTRDNRIFAAAWGIYDSNGGIYEVCNDQLISRASEFDLLSKEAFSMAYDQEFEKLYVGTKDAGLFEVSLNPKIKFQELGVNVIGFARTANSSAVLSNTGILLNRAEKEFHVSLLQFKKWQENYVNTTVLPLPRHEDDFYELDYTIKAEEISFYDIKSFQNNYWINTNIGLFEVTPSGELKRYLPLHTEEINFTPEGDLIETNPYGGVRIYSDLDTFQYTYFDKAGSHTPTMVVNSLQKGRKTFLLSIFSGLYVWENQRFTSYLTDGIWKEKKLKHITALRNDLAVSNEFGDVFIVNDKTSFKIKKKIPRAKIQGNSIVFLKAYGNILIIGTEKGITFYKNGRYIFIDKEQGLEQPLLSARVSENNLSIGSNNGYYAIDIGMIVDTEALVDDIELEEILVNNQQYSPEELQNNMRLDLAHHQNTVHFSFSTNAHPYPKKLKYQYRLNAGEEWSPKSSNPEIFLPSLPTDSYEVDIKISDESTGLTYIQPMLSMTILPPFWKTWWFAFLLISTAIIMIYSVYVYQIRQQRKFEVQKGMIQKRFEETKMEALLAQMNPHFIFNAMNSIQYYIVDNDIDKATGFLGDFAKLIRLNLDHCTKPTILLEEEIEYLQSYIRIENTRFNNRIKVIFEVDPLIDTFEKEIPTMLLQTFVENVFVHAFPESVQNPTLKISFNLLSEGILLCKIIDNGIGFSSHSTNKLHQSKGVALVKERLSLLGYDVEKVIKIKSAVNKGTSIILKLQV